MLLYDYKEISAHVPACRFPPYFLSETSDTTYFTEHTPFSSYNLLLHTYDTSITRQRYKYREPTVQVA